MHFGSVQLNCMCIAMRRVFQIIAKQIGPPIKQGPSISRFGGQHVYYKEPEVALEKRTRKN